MHINKINSCQYIYFTGKENEGKENLPKKSYIDVIKDIDFEPQSSQMSLLDAIKLRQVEEKAKQLPDNYSLNIEG